MVTIKITGVYKDKGKSMNFTLPVHAIANNTLFVWSEDIGKWKTVKDLSKYKTVRRRVIQAKDFMRDKLEESITAFCNGDKRFKATYDINDVKLSDYPYEGDVFV